jgi:hypothetical protein
LEEDLDRLLKSRDEGATACWGAPVFDNCSDSNEEYQLTISWSQEGLEKGSHRSSRGPSSRQPLATR